MADMIVRLYDLPSMPILKTIECHGCEIRRAMAYERHVVVEWVGATFNPLWGSECATAFGRQPVGCYIAVQANTIRGFCCVETTFRGFVGPIGVASAGRGQGLGKALLLTCLEELRHRGHAYAIVGDAGEPGFFASTAGAVEIKGSTPGPYPLRLK